MRNAPLIVLLVLCTVFIIALNLAYLQKVVTHSKAHDVTINDQPSPSQKDTTKSHDVKSTKKKVPETSTTTTKSSSSNTKTVPDSSNTPVEFNVQQTKSDDVMSHSVAGHQLAGLNCDKFGGPSEKIADEMVYWRDIPTDAEFVSPFAHYGKSPKYLTFEPDEGGWNNIRMSMETATVLAHAMGRILVLPPEQQIYLLSADQKKNRFTFKDFFHFDSIAAEHPAVEVISMEEFMKREAITGNLVDRYTGKITFPPNNETLFDGHGRRGREHWLWLRNATMAPIWFFDDCVAAFPSMHGPAPAERLKDLRKTIDGVPHIAEYFNNPTEVDASAEARLREILGTRRKICVYEDSLQNEKVIHFMGDNASGARLLVHFYAFLFFEDYHQDLWTKRFVRDHLRYIDEIQCAAARVVHAVRQKAIENGSPDGIYDSFHIRRGDFQYKETRISAEQIYENTKDVLEANSTIFIATDEKDMRFFDPLRKHYHLLFLHDFKHLFKDLNTNYMGMLDQRIASRGRTFIGAFFSTFTGYINRMRGYHSQKDRLPGWEKGEINSYFYIPLEHKLDMRKYTSIKQPMWGREFPVGWRDIDHDLAPNAYRSTD